jgi:hypothetical protein
MRKKLLPEREYDIRPNEVSVATRTGGSPQDIADRLGAKGYDA